MVSLEWRLREKLHVLRIMICMVLYNNFLTIFVYKQIMEVSAPVALKQKPYVLFYEIVDETDNTNEVK